MKDLLGDGLPEHPPTRIIMQPAQRAAAERLHAALVEVRMALALSSDSRMLKWLPHLQRPEFATSMRNLSDWLALRALDLSPYQQDLSDLGLSSLGRADAHVRAALDAVIAVLAVLTGQPEAVFPTHHGAQAGADALVARRDALFGDRPDAPHTRIMVTLPTAAAEDARLITALAEAGVDCFRINCAHDTPQDWARMIGHIRTAEARIGRKLPVSMDLAGPKVRIDKVIGRKKDLLETGDRFAVIAGEKAVRDDVPCVLLSHPALFAALAPGQMLSIDDGKLWAVVDAIKDGAAALTVRQAPAKGFRLKPEKGVNLPGAEMRIAALTAADRAALDFICAHADMVAYSFVQTPEDVDDLIDAMARRTRGRPLPAVILKIETALGLRNLPELIACAGAEVPVGVMIARGDLAVEIGFDRLSEIQEEILWLCEAAQVPVIWATQVLESLVKDGQATRAEVTDAAMGQRAECVMLNKGAHVVQAVGFLRDILGRMDRHLAKKRARLGPLGLWRDG